MYVLTVQVVYANLLAADQIASVLLESALDNYTLRLWGKYEVLF